ncbi:hypothetical protein C5B96_13290 [Subtercola sp. Z020]|uniref:TetR/AcrR family transcriptional regulator n=1 Tax=Subtercola sp. Z020 TaxID=2080582 RepID=UPI000CE8967C|nr:TetR/AcrR family transcriptional regulator [Subtercola sp. Z020]PPF79145.1 hypothetical protein C5B96_13290 [Subtercola sp. Z020]
MPQQPRVRAERVEVRRSRDRILGAAENYYAVHNDDPTMSQLAQLAGVGNATLYRRYASVPEVIRALYTRTVGYQQAVIDEMALQPSGWDAVVTLITGVAEVILEHPAVPRVTRKMLEIEPGHRHGAQWNAVLVAVAARAQAEGALRPDVDVNDLTMAAFRVGDYSYLPVAARARVVARQLAIVLDGLRADSVRTSLPGDGIHTDEIQTFFHEHTG